VKTTVLLLIAGMMVALAGCGGGGPSPTQVAAAADATACDNSGFYMQSKLSDDKAVIFDCRFAKGLPKCVTYSGNIATDASAEVTAVFATSLNSQRPRCLADIRHAKARAARARNLRYLALVRRDRRAKWHRGFLAYWQDVARYTLPNVYAKWLPLSYSCSAYITSCWKIEIVTRHGCPNALSVEVEEVRGSRQVGTAYGSGGSIRPYVREDVEVDTMDNGPFRGRIGTITCI
jgi:hypothetical protein